MMSLQSLQDLPLLRRVYEDFEEGNPVRVACINIVRFIALNQTKVLTHLTFGMLLRAAELDDHQGEILHRAIAYLTGARANLLLIGYEYIQEDYEHELEPDEVEMLLTDNQFYDPRTGEAVENCANHIYIFFRPNYAAFH